MIRTLLLPLALSILIVCGSAITLRYVALEFNADDIATYSSNE